MNEQQVTVREALERGLNDFDDPVLLWGECRCGGRHVAGELFDHLGRSVLRCCCCGHEEYPADEIILTIHHSEVDELEPMDA